MLTHIEGIYLTREALITAGSSGHRIGESVVAGKTGQGARHLRT
jgi:hypothetical protein